jgi:hypothetical protein
MDVLLVENHVLTSVDCPALESIGGSLIVRANLRLRVLSMPRLTTVSEYVHISHEASLVALVLPSLSLAGHVLVEHSDVQSISIPALRAVSGDVSIADNNMLTAVSLSSLARVGGVFVVVKNEVLSTLATSSLMAINGNVSICENSVQFVVPALLLSANTTLSGACAVQSGSTPCLPVRPCQ